MSSTTAWPLCETEASSVDLVDPVRHRLLWWIARPAEHARYLNTLALMEHIGSRKIMVSQTRNSLSQDVLKHLAEETRHSYFFKRAAEGLAGRELNFDDNDAVRPASAKMYFGRLDAEIARDLGADVHAEVPYLYVSLIIELRAIWTYRLHQQALIESGAKLSLKSLLAEEEHHLEQMMARLGELDPDLNARIERFTAVEDRLFRGLWLTLDGAYESIPHAA